MTLATVRKFIVALLGMVGVVLTVLLANGLTEQWVTITLAVCQALGVYLVPNARPRVATTTANVPTTAP